MMQHREKLLALKCSRVCVCTYIYTHTHVVCVCMTYVVYMCEYMNTHSVSMLFFNTEKDMLYWEKSTQFNTKINIQGDLCTATILYISPPPHTHTMPSFILPCNLEQLMPEILPIVQHSKALQFEILITQWGHWQEVHPNLDIQL